MLQIKNVRKEYVTGDLHQMALNDVSFNLRDNEFVAILGPSGSGKTTLLNLIGGLDRYDDGDLIINNISTKKYTDRDWDSYRNHTIGFVFQSYNLIPHQSVLANVELALTISGISKSERRKKAKEALIKVGLEDHIYKKPNQMSGGQMQRVAIARALVNDPEILLADEPTGALDTDTSVQVMELLKEVAQDRLVVLVTHNNELADEYANRIIKLKDGKIVGDTNPLEIDNTKLIEPKHKNLGKSSMSFFTSLALSFNNLRTKKARTFLTAFAGSIGIIGIALILSLSTGVNQYIADIQKDTMTSYPISIEEQSFDLSSLMSIGMEEGANRDIDHELDGVYSNAMDVEMVSSITSSIKENNLTEFKAYLDNPDSEIHQYIGENGIAYTYNIQFDTYSYDVDGTLVNTDGSTFTNTSATSGFGMGMMGGDMSGMSSAMTNMLSASSTAFEQLLPGTDGELVSKAVTDSYDLLYGTWPAEYNEVVLRVDSNNEISLSTLYTLGILPAAEYKDMLEIINAGGEVEAEEHSWTYEEICSQTFYMIPACDYYEETENGQFTYIANNSEKLDALIANAVELKIVGVIRVNEDASYSGIYANVGYTSALTDYVIEHTNNSPVVLAQEKSEDVNVLNGMTFAPENDSVKVEDTLEYLAGLNTSEKAIVCTDLIKLAYSGDPETMSMMLSMSEIEIAAMLDQFLETADDDSLLMIYDSYISTGTYDDNMSAFGVVSLSAPSGINIYADSFEDKDKISACINDYNKTVSAENQISYTDYVGLLMSSITTIVNVISYVLIAFVAVSLVVSSIMIGIITYISVLERTKEIGILRAIGASKRNISQVFNAETFIIGSFSGLLGVVVTLLLLIPSNALIHHLTGTTDVSAALPVGAAVILVLLSMALTLIAGLIPSKKAAKKDPVIALRSE